jgi:hypothetical protein
MIAAAVVSGRGLASIDNPHAQDDNVGVTLGRGL